MSRGVSSSSLTISWPRRAVVGQCTRRKRLTLRRTRAPSGSRIRPVAGGAGGGRRLPRRPASLKSPRSSTSRGYTVIVALSGSTGLVTESSPSGSSRHEPGVRDREARPAGGARGRHRPRAVRPCAGRRHSKPPSRPRVPRRPASPRARARRARDLDADRICSPSVAGVGRRRERPGRRARGRAGTQSTSRRLPPGEPDAGDAERARRRTGRPRPGRAATEQRERRRSASAGTGVCVERLLHRFRRRRHPRRGPRGRRSADGQSTGSATAWTSSGRT